MKLVQVLEYNTSNIFFKNRAKNKARRVPNLILFVKKLNLRKNNWNAA